MKRFGQYIRDAFIKLISRKNRTASESSWRECSCNRCQSACSNNPGWFKPGEAEKSAALLNLSMEEFFAQYLGVDWQLWKWPSKHLATFGLAPAITRMTPGHLYPAFVHSGVCIFLTDEGKCKIHAAKPFECREYYHEDSNEQSIAKRQEAVTAWELHQSQIIELLPMTEAASVASLRDSGVLTDSVFKHAVNEEE